MNHPLIPHDCRLCCDMSIPQEILCEDPSYAIHIVEEHTRDVALDIIKKHIEYEQKVGYNVARIDVVVRTTKDYLDDIKKAIEHGRMLGMRWGL